MSEQATAVSTSTGSPKFLFFGTYDVRMHPRVQILQEGLKANNYSVEECNVPLGLPTAWRLRLVRYPWLMPVLVARIASAWLRLALRARRAGGPFDAVFIGYLGHFDIHLARLLFRKTTLVLDFLVSGRETARDRRVRGRLRGRILSFIDRRALRAADMVLVDTDEHAGELTGDREKAVVVPVGVSTEWFREPSERRERDELSVVFFGLYTPLQGTPIIAEAIARLVNLPVRFTMIGHGQDLDEVRASATGNPRVSWLRWVPAEELPSVVAGHDICLGIFGTSPKAHRVVPNKVFQGAAAGCAVLTSDTPPQRAALGDAGIFVPPGDAEELAATLLALASDRDRVEQARRAAYRQAHDAFGPPQVVGPLIERLDRFGSHRRVGAAVARPHRRAPLTPRAWLRYDLIKRALSDLPDGSRILEIGAGQGAMASRLATRFDYVAVEQDEESAALASARLEQLGCRPVFRDVADVADSNFDAVCAFEVLEHIEDDLGALTTWAKRLRSGGRLVLSVPAHQSMFGPWDVFVGHYRRYDPGALAELLRRAGFSDVHVRLYGFPLGNLLEAARNAVIRHRPPAESMHERTGHSGRLLQPSGPLGVLTGPATVPFRLMQRPFQRTPLGNGIVAWARWGE